MSFHDRSGLAFTEGNNANVRRHHFADWDEERHAYVCSDCSAGFPTITDFEAHERVAEARA